MYRKYGTPKMQEQFSVMSTIHGAYPMGQRFALLKIAPGNLLCAPFMVLHDI